MLAFIDLLSKLVSVRGNLGRSYDFLKSTLLAQPAILDIVANGYKLPFTNSTQFMALNSKSSIGHTGLTA